jgi:hypothetical protein
MGLLTTQKRKRGNVTKKKYFREETEFTIHSKKDKQVLIDS